MSSPQRLAHFLREIEIEDTLRRHRLRWFDALGGNRDHFALQFFIYGS